MRRSLMIVKAVFLIIKVFFSDACFFVSLEIFPINQINSYSINDRQLISNQLDESSVISKIL